MRLKLSANIVVITSVPTTDSRIAARESFDTLRRQLEDAFPDGVYKVELMNIEFQEPSR